MQFANILLAIGGDEGQTVPKYRVSAAEIAVLQAIHGEAAVREIEPCETTRDGIVSNRAELARLRATYGHAKDSDDNSIVEQLFPGAAARVFETLEELEIDESFYKAERRVSAKADPLDHDGNGKKGGSKPAEPTADFDEMTKAQLVEYAKANDLEFDPSANKAEILAAVKAGVPAQAAKTGEDAEADEDGVSDMNDNLFD